MAKVYQSLTQCLMAIRNCQAHDDNRPHWDAMEDMHRDRIAIICREHLPHGSGFDWGCSLDVDASSPERLVISCDWHKMNEGGYYCGRADYRAIVRASLAFDFELRIVGRDWQGVKDYIAETMRAALLDPAKF